MTRVLFVCVKNAGRSVMAEALFNRMAGGAAEAMSAGTAPQERPHREVVAERAFPIRRANQPKR